MDVSLPAHRAAGTDTPGSRRLHKPIWELYETQSLVTENEFKSRGNEFLFFDLACQTEENGAKLQQNKVFQNKSFEVVREK